MMFCQDCDLLEIDSSVFGYAGVGQMIAYNAGTLSGTVVTSPTVDLVAAGAQVGQVVTLSGAVVGQFPILAVTSATLTITLLTATMYPDDGSAGSPQSPYVDSGSVSFLIRTFWPYRRTISDQLLAAAGVPIFPVANIRPTVLNPQDFKRACVLGTLAMIYNAMNIQFLSAAGVAYQTRADIYSTLYTQAIRSIRAELDWNNDGKPEELRYLGEIAMRRA